MIRILSSLLLGAVVSSRGTKRYNVKSGKSVTLVCDENNSDTEFFRSFGVNQPLMSLQGPRYSLKNGKLTISETSLDDDGDFLCGREKSSKIKLSVIVQPETIQIQEKRADGTARIIEDRNAVLSGKASKAQLTCSVSPAYPKPKISWILKSTGQEILDTVVESKSVEVNSLLGNLDQLENGANSRQRKLANRRRSRRLVQVTSIVTLHLDENRYTDGSDIICQVDQGVVRQTLGVASSQSGVIYGMGSSNSVSDSTSGNSFSHTTQVKLELVTVPRVHRFELESGNRGQLLQGDLLRFRCEAHSTPAVQKYRLFVGNRVIAETVDGVFGEVKAIKEFNGDVLSCQGVTDEAGAGAKYELEARLNVKYPPELISTSHLQKTSPNEPATLSCNFDANPEPTIHWFYKERNSNIGSKIIGTGQKLTIENPSWKNSGEYMCQANNNHGDIKTASAFLSVYGKPRINSAIMMIEGDFVEFECDFVSHPEVNGTSVDCGEENGKKSKNRAKPVKISDKRFKIPIESFEIKSKCVCVVENEIGIDRLEFQPENPAFFESQIKSENFSSGELILVLICTILFLSAMMVISFGFWVCWKRRMNSGHFSSSNSKLYSPKLEAGSHSSNSSRAEKLSLADSRGSSEFEEKLLLKVNGNSYLSQSHPDSSSGISSYVILDGSEPENKKLVVIGAKSTKSVKSVKSAKGSVHGADARSIHGNSAHGASAPGTSAHGTSAHATSLGNPDISLGSRHSDRHSSANDDSGSSGHGTMAIGSGTLPTRKTKIRKIPSSKSMNCSLNTSASDDLYDPSRIRQISEIMQQVKPAKKIKSITHV